MAPRTARTVVRSHAEGADAPVGGGNRDRHRRVLVVTAPAAGCRRPVCRPIDHEMRHRSAAASSVPAVAQTKEGIPMLHTSWIAAGLRLGALVVTLSIGAVFGAAPSDAQAPAETQTGRVIATAQL